MTTPCHFQTFLTAALRYPPEHATSAVKQFLRQLESLIKIPILSRILILYQDAKPPLSGKGLFAERLRLVQVSSWLSAAGMESILENSETDILLLIPTAGEVEIAPHGLERFMDVARDTGAAMVYADAREIHPGVVIDHPTLDYQLGSIRETFDFGSMVLISKKAAEEALRKHGGIESSLRWAGFYDLRLKLSIDYPIVHIPEALYTKNLTGTRLPPSKEDLKRRDEFDASCRKCQLEVERVATAHLRRLKADARPCSLSLPEPDGQFPVIASIIIPVRNRENTIAAAIRSAVSQKTRFSFNIIVVDDHSTDGTTGILQALSKQHPNLLHIIPRRTDLGIGGLWNEAIYSPECGLCAMQLDSDDVYADIHALEEVVNKFWGPLAEDLAAAKKTAPQYAMVIGSFIVVDSELKPIPPGLMDHPELVGENCRNNALRVDGLGAPRAFYVPLLRQFSFPNLSFGEDYALCLRISRDYEVGRILKPLYLARQWEGNTRRSMPFGNIRSVDLKNLFPAATVSDPRFMARLEPISRPLAIASKNRYIEYKDWLRSVEIEARRRQNN
jgi:glycosyltransferase involved in cell wall biosynthesis